MIRNQGKYQERKSEKLGIPIGPARFKLGKMVDLMLVQKAGMDICFQCGKLITDPSELSIEHKVPFINSENSIEMFFDLDNIAFSHLKCNIAARKAEKEVQHGTKWAYVNGCRCEICSSYWSQYLKDNRDKKRTNGRVARPYKKS